MEKEYKVIANPRIARQLLHRGHKLTDIKPDKFVENASLFIFEVSADFLKDLAFIVK